MFQFWRFVMMSLTAVLLLSACGRVEETAVSVISPTPTPTLLPTVTATLVPTHTATAIPSPTYTPTVTPSPTALPTETRTPRPSATPKPNATIKPDASPEPTSTWDRYQTRTLSKIQELTDPFLAETVTMYPTMYLEFSEEYQYPSRVRVIYSGEFRNISPNRKFALERWAEVYLPNLADKYISLFQHEVLVSEGDDEYWMPVQEPLIPYMEDELTAGGKATMFVVWMGAIIPSAEEVERIYLINEFRQ